MVSSSSLLACRPGTRGLGRGVRGLVGSPPHPGGMQARSSLSQAHSHSLGKERTGAGLTLVRSHTKLVGPDMTILSLYTLLPR